MREAILLTALFAAAYCGLAALALAQPRHWGRATGADAASPRQVRRLRAGGGGLLAAAFVLALLRDGTGFGIVLWATMISLAAIAVALTLAWRPRWVRAIAVPFGLSGAARGR